VSIFRRTDRIHARCFPLALCVVRRLRMMEGLKAVRLEKIDGYDKEHVNDRRPGRRPLDSEQPTLPTAPPRDIRAWA